LEPVHILINPIRQAYLPNPSSSNWYRNINLFPIGYSFRTHLRGRLTLRRLSLLMSAFALLIPPACFTTHLRRLTERSSTILKKVSAASVHHLAPLNLRRRPTRTVSYYAFFKGWLLLSQPPVCLCLPTSFPTERCLGTLAGGLGCFPLDYGR
jgi:hypothetical protein